MNPIFKKIGDGIILFKTKNYFIKYNRGKLYRIFKIDKNKNQIWNIPYSSMFEKYIYSSNLLSRLLRKGVHHFQLFDNDRFILQYNRDLCKGSFNDAKIFGKNSIKIKGSRPLSLQKISDKIVFGEYRSNDERSEISIFCFDDNKNKIIKLFSLNNVRHIHGIYEDPYTKKIWLTSGDLDEESAICTVDKSFGKINKEISGSQQTRAIKLLFDENYIYFGSDTPEELNHIYRFNKKTKN